MASPRSKEYANGFFQTEYEPGKTCPWKKECFEYNYFDIKQMQFSLTPEIIEGLDWCMRKQRSVLKRTITLFKAVKAIKQTVTGKKDSYQLKGKIRTHHLSWLSESGENNPDLRFASSNFGQLYEMVLKADENTKTIHRMLIEFKKSLKTHPAK